MGTTTTTSSATTSTSGHPHVCGDYGFARLAGPEADRAIPTCVGTTPRDQHPTRRRPGHPHVRGDYGNPVVSGRYPRRAIPTCVGTAPPAPTPPTPGTGHPHVCGDYTQAIFPQALPHGPSPRVLGLLGDGPGVSSVVRAIPTCVGTTSAASSFTSSATGHPHVCGDYGQGKVRRRHPRRAIPTCVGTTVAAMATLGEMTGPSPRAWGLRRAAGGRRADLRAIPTCVGTTGRSITGAWRMSGHPHMRGDYTSGPTPHPEEAGPSPRVWGLWQPEGACAKAPRAIPTCVGTTPGIFPPGPPPPGHPHVRGDYLAEGMEVLRQDGPSPRAWGLPPGLPGAGVVYRAIPTCVGTTAT